MKRAILLLAFVMGFSVVFADSLDLKQIPESAKYVLHFDVKQFKETAMGKECIGRALENKDIGRLNQVLELFGVDPINHIFSVTVYGDDFAKNSWLMIVNGSFSAMNILEQVKQNGKYEKEVLNGVETYVITLDSKTFRFFSEGSNVYISKEKNMIEKHTGLISGKTKSVAEVPSDMIASVNTNCIFALSVASGFPIHEKNPIGEVLKKVDSVSVNVREDGGYVHSTLVLVSQDEESSKLLQSTILGFASLGKMQGEKLALAKETLDTLEVSVNGKKTVINSKVSVENLIKIIEAKGLRNHK